MFHEDAVVAQENLTDCLSSRPKQRPRQSFRWRHDEGGLSAGNLAELDKALCKVEDTVEAACEGQRGRPLRIGRLGRSFGLGVRVRLSPPSAHFVRRTFLCGRV